MTKRKNLPNGSAQAPSKSDNVQGTGRLQRLHELQLPVLLLGVIVWDPELRVIEWNLAAEVIFGYTKSEAVGRHANDLIVPNYEQPATDQVWSRVLDGEDRVTLTSENVTNSGEVIRCEWIHSKIPVQRRGVNGILSLVKDVSHRVSAGKGQSVTFRI